MKVIIRDNIFKVKLCTTPSSITEGMMKKRFDENFNGMLFMMPESTEQSFWMYNCIIPLDIIMIDDGKIREVHDNCPPCTVKDECEKYNGYGNQVLELEGGTCKSLGIKKGDPVSFSLS